MNTNRFSDFLSAAAEYAQLSQPARPYNRAQAIDATIGGTGFEKLLAGFNAAHVAGLKRPKLRIGALQFSLAKEVSRNPGFIYVKCGEAYLGKIDPYGRWSRAYECSNVEHEEVVRVGRDPFGALVAHGHLTGNCGICSRPLSDPESTQRGIGPTCARKYGWL